jgi:hypothetical protein
MNSEGYCICTAVTSLILGGLLLAGAVPCVALAIPFYVIYTKNIETMCVRNATNYFVIQESDGYSLCWAGYVYTEYLVYPNTTYGKYMTTLCGKYPEALSSIVQVSKEVNKTCYYYDTNIDQVVFEVHDPLGLIIASFVTGGLSLPFLVLGTIAAIFACCNS